MVTCECGQEFEDPTKRQVHKLSGNCPHGKRRSGSRTTGRKVRKRPHQIIDPSGNVQQPLQHGNRQQYATKAGTWHFPVSVYVEIPRDMCDTPEQLHALLDVVKRQLLDRVKDVDILTQFDDVRITRTRYGYNIDHCHLNQSQKLFGRGLNG